MYPVLVHKVADSWRWVKRCDRDEIEARDLSASRESGVRDRGERGRKTVEFRERATPVSGRERRDCARVRLWPDDAQPPHRRDSDVRLRPSRAAAPPPPPITQPVCSSAQDVVAFGVLHVTGEDVEGAGRLELRAGYASARCPATG